MAMTGRVRRLRQESLDAVPTLSVERARLMKQVYKVDCAPQDSPLGHAASASRPYS